MRTLKGTYINIHKLTNRPKKLQEKIFAQLFDQASLSQLDDTAFDEGKIEGNLEAATKMKLEKLDPTLISLMTWFSSDEIDLKYICKCL